MIKRIFALMLALTFCLALGTPALAAGGFRDVDQNAWYFKYLDTAVRSGLINGRGDERFAPHDDITGAEAVKLAACIGQRLSDGFVSLTNGFPWYASYMTYAVENNIIDAGLDQYAINAPVMRAELMDMICRAIPEAQRKEINSIPDGAIPDLFSSAYYRDNIYTLYRMGIVTGSNERGACLPDACISRAEVATLVARVIDENLRVPFSLEAPASTLVDLRRRAEAAGALCAVAILNYDSVYGEAAPQDLYPFLVDIPAANNILADGYERYLIVPCTGVTACVYDYVFDWEGSGGYMRGDLLAEFDGEPFTLRCNYSDIVSNTLIVLTTENGETFAYSPSISLKDGTLAVSGSRIYDFTRY